VPSSPSPTTHWNPADYAANSAVQLAWARELIGSLHLRGDEHILDIGCGDGKITAELAQAVPRGSATGIDASAPMIDFARAKFAGQDFQVMDARAIHFDPKFDLVFSNAALHWVDDHEAFLRGAAGVLRPGGRLAVSCGGQGNAQAMTNILHAIMRRKRWRAYFRDLSTPYFFYTPEQYRTWLDRANFQAHRVDLTPKDAFYDGITGLTAWLRTAWLPYTQRVPEPNREEFISQVAEGYVTKHRTDPQGRVSVHMVRLEIEAKLPTQS
jgi:trans-aconitate 2-methyltransferase